METCQVRPLDFNDVEAIVELSDELLGTNYMTIGDLNYFFGHERHKSTVGSFVFGSFVLGSFVLVGEENNVQGFRLTFAPGCWPPDLLKLALIELWPISVDAVAYFKTILINSPLQGQGWGPRLSLASPKAVRAMGADSIVCHCWKESLNNSSQRYLSQMDFKPLGEIKNFWQNKNYKCVRCQPDSCKCTAIEMYSYRDD